ncbi:hypothetical protein GCM10027075_19570 [Streptomyces heilongjiangensis]
MRFFFVEPTLAVRHGTPCGITLGNSLVSEREPGVTTMPIPWQLDSYPVNLPDPAVTTGQITHDERPLALIR